MSFPAKLIRFFYLLLVFIVPLIFLPNTSELFEFNKMVVTYLLTLFIVTAWVARMIIEKKPIFRRTILDLPLLIFLFIQLLSLFLSIDIRSSLMGYYSRFNGGLLSLLCYSLLYWAAVSNLDRKSTLSIINWSLITAALVAIWGFLEHFGIDAAWWVQKVQDRVFSTLGQPNWLAAYLVALIFIPVSRVLSTHKPRQRLLFCFSAILFFLVLIFTKSRSGLLAFGISSVLFWSLTLFLQKTRAVKPFVIFCLMALTIAFAIPNPVRDLVFSKFNPGTGQSLTSTAQEGTSLETGGTESGTIRKIVWTGAFRIWRASAKNFWLGSGPETFAMAYYQYRPLEHNATSEWELLYNKAHNEFLNYLSTTGLLGLSSYLILLGFMGYIFFTSRTNSQMTNDQMVKSALAAGWLSISVTNFWGFSVVIMQIFLFLFPALALTLNQETPVYKPVPQKTWQYISQLVLYSSALFLLYSLSTYWLADISYASGQKAFRAFNSTQDPQYILTSYRDLTRAYELNPIDPPISSELSVSAAFMSLLINSTNATAAAQLADISNMASLRAIHTSPFHPNYYKSRSRTMVVLGTLDPKYFAQSDLALQEAQIISPTDPRIPYIRAITAKYANHPDLAKKYLEQALRLKPDFADALAQLKNLASPSADIQSNP